MYIEVNVWEREREREKEKERERKREGEKERERGREREERVYRINDPFLQTRTGAMWSGR